MSGNNDCIILLRKRDINMIWFIIALLLFAYMVGKYGFHSSYIWPLFMGLFTFFILSLITGYMISRQDTSSYCDTKIDIDISRARYTTDKFLIYYDTQGDNRTIIMDEKNVFLHKIIIINDSEKPYLVQKVYKANINIWGLTLVDYYFPATLYCRESDLIKLDIRR